MGKDINEDPKIRIGLLEDDIEQSALLEIWLADAGYHVSSHTGGNEFVRAVQSQGYDLLLLDWNVPEMTGMDVLEWVRRNVQWHIPIVFLTSRDEEESIVAALAAGADDYITKPARRLELLARVEAVGRRSGLADKGSSSGLLEVHGYVLDRKRGVVSIEGEALKLTQREFDLAYFLFENLGKVLSRDYLLQQVWNMTTAVNTRTVDTHMSRIRSKLNLRPENGWRLSSVYHYGYRLERLSQ